MQTDESLMTALQEGDRSAYQELYSRYAHRVLRFLARRLCSLQVAEEALQETFLRVYRFRHRYTSPRPFSPWLFTIAANVGKKVREPRSEGFLWDPAVSSRSGMRVQLLQTLHALEDSERTTLLLHAEGFSSPQIAEILTISESAVRMRMKRARARLKAELGALDEA